MKDNYKVSMLGLAMEEMMKDRYNSPILTFCGRARNICIDMDGIQLLEAYYSGQLDEEKIFAKITPGHTRTLTRDSKNKAILFSDGLSVIRTFKDYLDIDEEDRKAMFWGKVFEEVHVCYPDGRSCICSDFKEVTDLPVLQIEYVAGTRKTSDDDETMIARIYLDAEAADDMNDQNYTCYEADENGVIIGPMGEEIRNLQDIDVSGSFSGEIELFIRTGDSAYMNDLDDNAWSDNLEKPIKKIMSSKDGLYHEIYMEG